MVVVVFTCVCINCQQSLELVHLYISCTTIIEKQITAIVHFLVVNCFIKLGEETVQVLSERRPQSGASDFEQVRIIQSHC